LKGKYYHHSSATPHDPADYEKDSLAMAELRWSSPSAPNQLIPEGALSPPPAAP